jgi:hypothetical protein
MSGKKRDPTSVEVRHFEEKLLERETLLETSRDALPDESRASLPTTGRPITIQDTHASSLENWLDEFLSSNPSARSNLDGARALCRVSESSAEKWPSLAPLRNYQNTKYSNDLSPKRQRITPKKVLPQKYFLTPMFAQKADHYMFSKALKKKYNPANGRRLYKQERRSKSTKKMESFTAIDYLPVPEPIRSSLKDKTKGPNTAAKIVSFNLTEPLSEDEGMDEDLNLNAQELYPSTDESSMLHTSAPVIFPLPPILPPSQFLDASIKLNEPVVMQADVLTVLGQQDGLSKMKLSKKKIAGNKLRCMIRVDGHALMVNLVTKKKAETTKMMTLHASSGRKAIYIFPRKQSLIQAIYKTDLEYPTHIHLALRWALRELPVLLHGATIYASFSALIHGIQKLPPPLVLNQYASLTNRLQSPPNAVPSRQSKSPLLNFLNEIDPRGKDLDALTSIESLDALRERPNSAPGYFSNNDNAVGSLTGAEKKAGLIASQHGCTGGTLSMAGEIENRWKRSNVPTSEKRTIGRSSPHRNGPNQGKEIALKPGLLQACPHTRIVEPGADVSEEGGVPFQGYRVMDVRATGRDEFEVVGAYDHILDKPTERDVLLKTTMKLPDFTDQSCSEFRDFQYYFVEIIEVEHELVVTAVGATNKAVVQKRVSGKILASILSKNAQSGVLSLTSLDPNVPTICSRVLQCIATVQGKSLMFRDD